jgi:hypothetical protein
MFWIYRPVLLKCGNLNILVSEPEGSKRSKSPVLDPILSQFNPVNSLHAVFYLP